MRVAPGWLLAGKAICVVLYAAAVARLIDDVTFPGDKARHLTTALKMIEAKVGWLSLNHLKALTVDEARWELQVLPGVGVKVAACVLNFSDLAKIGRAHV